MFGFRRLKRRLRQFRYNNQARFPRLFVVAKMLVLPLQIALVVLPLWLAVSFYNSYFSYEAQNQRSRSVVGQTLPAETDTSISASVVTIDRTESATTDGIELDQRDDGALTMGSPVVEENISDAAQAGDELADAGSVNSGLTQGAGASQKVIEENSGGVTAIVRTVPVSVIEELPDDGETTLLEPLPGSEKQAEVNAVVSRLSGPLQIHLDTLATDALESAVINDANWLSQQDDGAFVIQIESSANVDVMLEKAQKLPAIEDLTVYPFVVSGDGEVVYGLSYGIYDTLGEATAATAVLPDGLARYGTWIRQVGTLKQQMRSIDPVLLNP